MTFKPRPPSALNANGSSSPPPSIDLIVSEPDLHRLESQWRTNFLQLNDHYTFREEVDLVPEVTNGIVFCKDKSIIIKIVSKDILLDGIQKVLIVSIILI